MEKFKSTEELLAWIIDFFAISFGNSAILKGGMSLRLLHSPRFTNDVDYVFIPFDSKKDVKQIIEKELEKVNNLTFTTFLNSKALRILISYGTQEAQVEISVEKECPSIPMSSSLLSTPYGRPARIIRIMDPSISFAHKIAAWNERNLMRDLYDIYQYESLFKIKPQIDVLKIRLKKAKPFGNTTPATNMNDLINHLTDCANSITEESFSELLPLLNTEELSGLSFRIKPAIFSLCESLKNDF